MKTIPLLFLGMVLPLSATAVLAKTVTTPENDNDRVINTIAGPAPLRAAPDARTSKRPNQKELKKTKVKPKPPLTDPN